MDIKRLLNDPSEPCSHKQVTRSRLPNSLREEGNFDYDGPSKGYKSKPKARRAVDAPIFERGPTVGEVKFWPHDKLDAATRQKLDRFQIFPPDEIFRYPQHIPYSSNKREFEMMTGRDRFELFHYTFKYGHPDTEWAVMWDYNIGLVRITPFFKSLGYSKTIPAKAIAMTPGLKGICWSITGGSLAAQGYWLPFEAAKALAATFCWKIRNALIPLFGQDFPQMCVRIENSNHVNFSIPQEIVSRCKDEVYSWTSDGPELFSKGERENTFFEDSLAEDSEGSEEENLKHRDLSSCEPNSPSSGRLSDWRIKHDEESSRTSSSLDYNGNDAIGGAYFGRLREMNKYWTPFHHGESSGHQRSHSASTFNSTPSWPTPPNDNFLKLAISSPQPSPMQSGWVPRVYTHKEITAAKALARVCRGSDEGS